MTERFVMAPEDLGRLVDLLMARGYEVVAPVLRDGVIRYDRIGSASELPQGWTDVQEPGGYRVRRRDDDARFGYVVGPHSWKRFLHPPRAVVWSGARTVDGFTTDPTEAPAKRAFLGARPCELAAIGVQDVVFTGGSIVDDGYAARRAAAVLIAVECTKPGGTCFCTSMGTGPAVQGEDFDLALTEVLEPEHLFVASAGSDLGGEILAELALEPAPPELVERARNLVSDAAARMGRSLDTDGLPELLVRNLEHPIWQEIASRCLTCTNCTMVCPTCFCSTVTDEMDLDSGAARRVRSWDSCFGLEFSYIHGGPLRTSASSRYRQWMTHKLSTWVDQFGMSGCVGCGRCITWCPVGIDITAEAARLRREEGANAG